MTPDSPPPLPTDSTSGAAANASQPTTPKVQSARATLSAAVTQRLQQAFTHANKLLEKGDYNYAHDLFTQCVSEDSSSLVYLQHFRANLAQMHPGGAKKSGGLGGFLGSGKSGYAKAVAKGDWQNAYATACNHLKKNPSDTATLLEMASGCGEHGYFDCQLYYLKWAHDLEPNSHEINRQSALALERIGDFDQAINCWLRIQKLKSNDEEAAKAIKRLSVEKTIDVGGYNPALLDGNAKDVQVDRPGQVASLAKSVDKSHAESTEQVEEVSTEKKKLTRRQKEDQLRQVVDDHPDQVKPYITLADFYVKHGQLLDAERLYRKALKIGGHNLEILETLEEVYLQRMRQRAIEAGVRLKKHPSDEAEEHAQLTVKEANQAEVEVFEARSTRNSADLGLKYEFGLRLKRVGQYREAIEPFQAARDDSKRTAEVNLLLGECFQQIGQHLLALRSYEASIEACDDTEWGDLRKLSTYRAGVLALAMKELDRAEAHLTNLADADFSYRDVSDRLDKISKIRNAT